MNCSSVDTVFTRPGGSPTERCDGYGTCSPTNGTCTCDPGWTFHGDFVSHSFQVYCGFNQDVIRVMYALAAVSNFLLFVMAVNFLHARIVNNKSSRHADVKIMGALTCAASFSIMMVGILRASEVDATIGNDVAISIFFAFGATSFWIAAFVMNHVFFRATVGMAKFHSAEHTNMLYRLRRRLILAACMIAPSNTCAPLIMLGVSRQLDVFGLALVHYVGCSLVMGSVGLFLVPRFAIELEDALTEAITVTPDNDGLFVEIKNKVIRYRADTVANARINIVIALIFGCWPFVQLCVTTYWLPIAWGVFAPIQMYQQLKMATPAKRRNGVTITTNDNDVNTNQHNNKDTRSTTLTPTFGQLNTSNRQLTIATTSEFPE